MAVAREYVKALIDRLCDEQVEALKVILESMAWPTEEITPEEAAELGEARAEIKAGKGVKAEACDPEMAEMIRRARSAREEGRMGEFVPWEIQRGG